MHRQTSVEFSVELRRNELDRAAAVIESVRPLVEAVCGPEVVACFNIAQAQQHVRERRYRVDAQVLQDHRRSVAATRALGPATETEPNESQRCFALSNLGMVLTWHGDLAEAEEVHEQALASVVRLGGPGARGRVRSTWRSTHCAAATSRSCGNWRRRRGKAASGRGFQDYVAAATALQAWVAWRDQQVGQALALGAQVLELWASQPESYPFQCLALWPLAGAHLDAGQVEGAVAAARQLLEPSQLRLPDDLEGAGAVGPARPGTVPSPNWRASCWRGRCS